MAMTSFSSSISEDSACTPPRLFQLGMTMMALVPMLVICSLMDWRDPSPMATMVITAATPITIPSTERKVRIRLRSRARKAIFARVSGFIRGVECGM